MTYPGRRTLRFGPAFALLLIGMPLGAQTPRWEAEAGAARIRYDSLDAVNSPSLAGLMEWEGESFLGRLGAGVTGLGDAGWSLQGRGDGALWLAPLGTSSPIRGEVGGSLAATHQSRGFDSHAARTDLRLHAVGTALGGWVGASGALARNSLDDESVTAVIPNAGAWVRAGPVRVTLSYMHTVLDGESWPEGNLSVAVSRGPLDLTGYAGARRSPFEDQDEDPWFGISAAWWVRPDVAVVASGGRYGADLLQGIPGGEFVSVGIRVATRRARPVPPEVPLPLIFSSDAANAGEIRFALPDAREVAVAGDWNDWTPTPLSRGADGRWILPPGVPPGVYRFNLVVDGARWVVPEGVPSIDDGFGGTVGLLVISRD